MSKISTSQIKKIKSLTMKKYRDEYGLFIVEGDKMVAEALNSGFQVEEVWRKEDIGYEAMARISQLSTPSPSVAIVRKPADTEIKLRPGLFLGLDGIRDPGNLGTILRVADWFGVDAVFASPDTVDIYNPKVVQSTMGAIFRVKFRYVDIPDLCAKILDGGGRVYGTFLDGRNIYEADMDKGSDRPVLMITGNESTGISPQVSALCSDRLYIPPYPIGEPGSESLNAAIATAIALSEFRRRLI